MLKLNRPSLLRFAARIFFAAAFLTASLPAQTPSPSPSPDPRFAAFKRYVQIDALSVGTRFRYIENVNGLVSARQGQYQVLARGRFKFDKKGRYSVGFDVQTGNAFNGGWNNTGWGTGLQHPNFAVRQLYFEAKPVDGMQLQIGGLAFERGENTEILTYDNDGYLVGERVTVSRPKRLYFDAISATRGYVGDLLTPNVSRRFHRLKEANYYQFLVRKAFNKHVSFSADYTYDSGSDTLRQAVKFTLPHKLPLDSILFENYERLDPSPGYGFNIAGQKKLNRYVTLIGGLARVDRVMLNADRFPPGTRIYGSALFQLSREFSVNAVGIHAVAGPLVPAFARTRLELIVSYNILATLQRFKIQ